MNRARILAPFVVVALAAPASAQFSYPDFSSTPLLNLVGATQITNGDLVLATSATFQAGAAWHSVQQDVAGGFETTFTYNFSSAAGADGLAFVLQNDAATALGLCGGSNGYSRGTSTGCIQGNNLDIQSALVVEFDLWNNTEYGDPSDNHVAAHVRQSSSALCHQNNALGSAPLPFDLNDGVARTAKIKHDGVNKLEVFITDMTIPVLTVPFALTSLALNGSLAWVGFTGATGGAVTDITIDSWSFGSCAGSAIPYGVGCAGTGGFVPQMLVSGCPESTNQIALEISKGLGGASSILLFGWGQGSFPIGSSGCSLLLNPLFGPPVFLTLSGTNPGEGSLFLPGIIAAGKQGISFAMQLWVFDPASPAGAAASNAVLVTIG